jgi:hypothetical protein
MGRNVLVKTTDMKKEIVIKRAWLKYLSYYVAIAACLFSVMYSILCFASTIDMFVSLKVSIIFAVIVSLGVTAMTIQSKTVNKFYLIYEAISKEVDNTNSIRRLNELYDESVILSEDARVQITDIPSLNAYKLRNKILLKIIELQRNNNTEHSGCKHA